MAAVAAVVVVVVLVVMAPPLLLRRAGTHWGLYPAGRRGAHARVRLVCVHSMPAGAGWNGMRSRLIFDTHTCALHHISPALCSLGELSDV